jgi:hypothetical protein
MKLYDIANQAEDVKDNNTGPTKFEPARAGVALMRMCSYIELGLFEKEWPAGSGKTKNKYKVLVEFELLHPDHKITRDGQFIGYHKVLLRLNKSGFGKAPYMQVFNKMNYAGAVAVEKDTIPSLSRFLGKPFMGQIYHNESKGKIYANLDKDQEYSIGAAQTQVMDDLTGLPTQGFRPITVPEMNAEPRLFLWEAPGMSKSDYHAMWDSIYIEGTRDDGASKNWIQEIILSPENLELPGSMAEECFVEGSVLPFKAEDTSVLTDLGIDDDAVPF